MKIAERGKNIPWCFTRKFPKGHGESTGVALEERIKTLIVGHKPKDGESVVLVDDVFTTGDTKYEARKTLESLGKFEYPYLVIAVDRQEISPERFSLDRLDLSASEEYMQTTGTEVISIVNAGDICEFLRERISIAAPKGKITLGNLERMEMYLRAYGAETVKRKIK